MQSREIMVRGGERDASRTSKVTAIVLVALLVGVGLYNWLRPSPPPPLVVQEGTEYKLLSYSIADTPVDAGQVPSYVLNIGWYNDEQTEMHHGSIMVPKMAALKDSLLPENTVVWDPKVSLEGRDYQVVRWNPSYSVRARERPLVSANDKPLTR